MACGGWSPLRGEFRSPHRAMGSLNRSVTLCHSVTLCLAQREGILLLMSILGHITYGCLSLSEVEVGESVVCVTPYLGWWCLMAGHV